jgi:natural product precursor
MKSKTLSKKVAFNKTTVANLSDSEMTDIKGGTTSSGVSYNTDLSICNPCATKITCRVCPC